MENNIFTELAVGTVVISRAGRDKGSPLMVVGHENGMILVADGKERPLERPKKKNPKHLIKTKHTISHENITDKALRRVLREMFPKLTEKQQSTTGSA